MHNNQKGVYLLELTNLKSVVGMTLDGGVLQCQGTKLNLIIKNYKNNVKFYWMLEDWQKLEKLRGTSECQPFKII